VVYRQLVADADAQREQHTQAGPGGHPGATLPSSAADLPPDIGTSDQSLPGSATTTLTPARVPDQPPRPRQPPPSAGAPEVSRRSAPPDERS
jgi:hypothetical protein